MKTEQLQPIYWNGWVSREYCGSSLTQWAKALPTKFEGLRSITKREHTSPTCPLTFTHVLLHVCPHISKWTKFRIFQKKENKNSPKLKTFRKIASYVILQQLTKIELLQNTVNVSGLESQPCPQALGSTMAACRVEVGGCHHPLEKEKCDT